MKRWIRFVARLYPASWRRRYGVEFDALLEDAGSDGRAFLDVMKGALAMQIRTWNVARTLAITGVMGALVALGISFAMPRRYVSTAVVEIIPQLRLGRPASAPYQAENDYMNRLAQRVLSRKALTNTIGTFELYRAERARMPIDDVIEIMRKRISIAPIRPAEDKNATAIGVSIQFASDDPVTAHTVAQHLTSRLIDENVRETDRTGAVTLILLDPANLPLRPNAPQRPLILAAGLAAGLAMGAILACLRATRRSARA
jgi:uncharacterized protein involved in exopolysaccharide biosynthesis